MDAAITLRPISTEDREFLYRLYASTREDVGALPWSKEQRQEFLAMQFAAQQKDYESRFPGAEHSIILVDGVAHGRIWIDRRVDEIRLLDIALLPQYRNQGTGQALVRQLIDEAAGTGRPLRHSVHQTNEAALRFYRRLGFEVVEDYGAYVLMEWAGLNRPAG